jgi:hypothetical protein
MATYKATMDVYLSGEGRFINAGETFSSNCIPGSTWDPLDDDAKAAVAERDGVRDPDSASASDAEAQPKGNGEPVSGGEPDAKPTTGAKATGKKAASDPVT